MAITKPEDPLFVTDFTFLPQECTLAKTDFDEDAQNEWMEDRMIGGHNPEHFARIWAHTHPGSSASPSSTDWETFQEAMAAMPWGVMLILGTSNEFVCVFRVGDELLNLSVEIEPYSVPDEWHEELKNIRKYEYKKNTGNQYVLNSGYDDEYWQDQGSSAAKRSKPPALELPYFLVPSHKANWPDLKRAYAQLPEKPNTFNADEWKPSFETLMEFGPCKAVKLIQQAYNNMLDFTDGEALDHVITHFSQTLCGEANEFQNYDTDNAHWWCPMALLNALREQWLTAQEYDGVNDDVKKYVYYNEAKKEWYVTQTPDIAKDIPDLLTSAQPFDREMAMAAIISTVLYFPDYMGEIDKSCKSFIEDFNNQKEEYDQCQKDHETNATSDTQASSTPKTSSTPTS